MKTNDAVIICLREPMFIDRLKLRLLRGKIVKQECDFVFLNYKMALKIFDENDNDCLVRCYIAIPTSNITGILYDITPVNDQ